MTIARLIRRLHLYLGLALLPWMAMFGASALLINHPTWWPDTAQTWTTIADRDYVIGPIDDQDLRPTGERIVRALGYDPSLGFGTYRLENEDVGVAIPNFRHPVRATYSLTDRRLRVERRAFAVETMLRDMHGHSGLWLRSPRQIAWTLIVDLVCLTMLFWIGSGLYMWWQLPGSRRLGWVAVGVGLSTFTALVLTL